VTHLISMAVVLFTSILMWLFLQPSYSLAIFLQVFAFGVVIYLAGAFVFFDDYRARSLTISSTGVTGLKWHWKFRIFPVGLTETTIPWSEMKVVGQNGLVVDLRSENTELSINTLLFEDPQNVVKVIIDKSERSRSN
jgi:hypothetical protein